MNSLLDVVRVAAALAIGPFTKTVYAVRETAMRFIASATGVKTTKI
jgi:hypothetical protein